MSRSYCGINCNACQLEVDGDEKCFGVVADEEHILVCRYGCDGSDPEIVSYTER